MVVRSRGSLPKPSDLSEMREHLSSGHVLQDHVKVGVVLDGAERVGKEDQVRGKSKACLCTTVVRKKHNNEDIFFDVITKRLSSLGR